MKYYLKRNLEISKYHNDREIFLFFAEKSSEISLNGRKWVKINDDEKIKKEYNLYKYEIEHKNFPVENFYVRCARCSIQIPDEFSILVGKNNFCPHCYKYQKEQNKIINRKLFLQKIINFYLRLFLIILISACILFCVYPFYYTFNITDNNETFFNYSAKSIAGNLMYKIVGLDKRFEYRIKNAVPLNVTAIAAENSNVDLNLKSNRIKVFSDSLIRFEHRINFQSYFYSMLPPRLNFNFENFSEIIFNILHGRILFKINNNAISQINLSRIVFKIVRTPAVFVLINDLPIDYDTSAFIQAGKNYNSSPLLVYMLSGAIRDNNDNLYLEGKEYRIDFRKKIKTVRDLSEIPLISEMLRSEAYTSKYNGSFILSLTAAQVEKNGCLIPVFKNPEEQLWYAEKFEGHQIYKIGAFEAAFDRAVENNLKEKQAVILQRIEEVKKAYETNKYEKFFLKNEN